MSLILAAAACAIYPSGAFETISRANGITVTMRLVKPSFVRGEPIGVEVTVANISNEDIGFMATSLPFSHLDYMLMLRFDLGRMKIEELDQPHFSFRPDGPCLKKGTKVRDVIYLQQFLSQPEPGEYRFPMRLLPLYLGGNLAFYGRTVLDFKITPGDKKKLNEIMSGYLETVRNSTALDERNFAAEALAVVEGAEALPYLARAINTPKSFRWHALYRSIERLSKDPVAVAKVIESLDTKGTPMTASEVLRVLSIWEFRLPNERIKDLQKIPDPALQKQLREYIEQMKKLYKETD